MDKRLRVMALIQEHFPGAMEHDPTMKVVVDNRPFFGPPIPPPPPPVVLRCMTCHRQIKRGVFCGKVCDNDMMLFTWAMSRG